MVDGIRFDAITVYRMADAESDHKLKLSQQSSKHFSIHNQSAA